MNTEHRPRHGNVHCAAARNISVKLVWPGAAFHSIPPHTTIQPSTLPTKICRNHCIHRFRLIFTIGLIQLRSTLICNWTILFNFAIFSLLLCLNLAHEHELICRTGLRTRAVSSSRVSDSITSKEIWLEQSLHRSRHTLLCFCPRDFCQV